MIVHSTYIVLYMQFKGHKFHTFVRISTAVPPTITAILSDTSAVSGSNHVIVCTAVADPAPAFGWRFNENLIQLNPAKHIISSNATHSVLTVLDLALSDGGTYTCSASNRYGGDSASANLTILCEYAS